MSVLRARCPKCGTGRVTKGVVSIRSHCPDCGYNCYPEPGFYLGAMCIGFFISAMLIIPLMIVLKLLDVDMSVLLAAPFIEFAFVGTFLIFYARILWLHLEYSMTSRLDGKR
jgi:uncharacterized protein (DUF983 family)